MRKLLVALFLALGVFLVPSAGSAAVVQNVKVPLNTTFLNPCTGDTIAFSGNIHLLAGVTADSNGGFHLHVADNVSGVTGVGSPSGITYHGVGGDWFEVNASAPFPFETTATDVFGLISTGSSPNLMANDTFHVTVNANGTMTAQVTRISFNCR